MNKTPHMNPETHRLTDLPGEKHPFVCQKCGGSDRQGFGNGLMRISLSRWKEHDHHDKPEFKLLVLCNKCSKEVIEQHPRLYARLQDNQPWPGCMDLCLDCIFRQGVSCVNPKAQANGGPGVMITVAKPVTAMVDGCRYRGPMALWMKPPTACRERELL